MNSVLRRNENKAASGVTSVDGAPISPAATEYYDPISANEDQSHVMVHEPTPVYEQKQPEMPSPTHHSDNTKLRTSHDYASQRGSHPSSINEDTVLGVQDQADVKRSGTWARGPGTSGIREDGLATGNHRRHASLAERATAAAQTIGTERETALSQAEKKDAKRLSKIIKAEGKSEDKQLKSALKELASLQVAQKKASAAEMGAVHAQSKAAKEEQKATSAYLEAKVRLEKAQANLRVCEERLTLTKGNAEKTTALVRRQAEDVDAMRERKATDDREREVKLATLKAGMLPQ